MYFRVLVVSVVSANNCHGDVLLLIIIIIVQDLNIEEEEEEAPESYSNEIAETFHFQKRDKTF